jgi:hypothetical protein
VDELSEEGVVAGVIVHPDYVMVCIVGMAWKVESIVWMRC